MPIQKNLKNDFVLYIIIERKGFIKLEGSGFERLPSRAHQFLIIQVFNY